MPARREPASVAAGRDGLFRVWEPSRQVWHGPFDSGAEAADFADALDRRGRRALGIGNLVPSGGPHAKRPQAAPTTLSLEAYATRRHTPVQAERPPMGVDPTVPYLHRSAAGGLWYVWSPADGRYLGPYDNETAAQYRLGELLHPRRAAAPRAEQGSLFRGPEPKQRGLFGNPSGRSFPRGSGKFSNTGGGCYVGPGCGDRRYPCDEQYEAPDGTRLDVHTTREAHFDNRRWPSRVRGAAELRRIPGVGKVIVHPPERARENPARCRCGRRGCPCGNPSPRGMLPLDLFREQHAQQHARRWFAVRGHDPTLARRANAAVERVENELDSARVTHPRAYREAAEHFERGHRCPGLGKCPLGLAAIRSYAYGNPAPRPRKVPVNVIEVQVRPRGPLSGRELHALQVLAEREARGPSAPRLPPGTPYKCSEPEVGKRVAGYDYGGDVMGCMVPERGRKPLLLVGSSVPLSRLRADAKRRARLSCPVALAKAQAGEAVYGEVLRRCPQVEDAVERYAIQRESAGGVPFDPARFGSGGAEPERPRTSRDVRHVYKIEPGNQYNRAGVSVSHTSSRSHVVAYEDVDPGEGGRLIHAAGDFFLNVPQVASAVRRTLQDRQPRTVVVGREPLPEPEEMDDEAAARRFDRLYNEGGEGYNPFRGRRR